MEERLAKEDKTKRVEMEKLGRTKEDKGNEQSEGLVLSGSKRVVSF
jgi:hypothetical protein